MQAVVLAAGEGTRMRPLSTSRPKPMLPVGDRPLLEHVMQTAVSAGVEELVLVVGYRGDVVRSRCGDTFEGVPVRYAEQTEQAGTADAVAAATLHLDGPFLVLNGDNLYDASAIEELVAEAPSVAAYRVANPSNYGVLSTADGEVTGVFEKPSNPPSDLVNAGAYVFPEEARNWLSVPMSERDERELTDVLAKTASERRVTAVTLDRWMDVGRPWELLDATEWRLRDVDATVAGDVSEDARLDGRVAVESGATVEAGATVEGPTLVRAGATVSRDAHVRGSTMVGRGVTVGPGVEVENSVLMSGVRLGEGAHVSDSVLASEVDVGAETTVANRRSDGEPVRVTVKGERVSTGRRAFGAVLGPGAQTGPSTSIAAGVTLAASATTAPGEVVTRDR